ncbi:MAG: two-component sensor histidine kinase [Myxococcales bacterium]|nr:two-component sensor histidine kinase [Myxococcales bacterium]
MKRLTRFFRANLGRRLFGWFGATILVTGASVALVMFLLTTLLPNNWRHELERSCSFLSHRYAAVWDDPAARALLTRHLSEDYEARVEVRGAQGEALLEAGAVCTSRLHRVTIDVERGGERLGEVFICSTRHKAVVGLLKASATLLTVLVVLWIISGLVARRLARPLGELAGVAESLGRGQLAERSESALSYGGEVSTLAESLHDMAARIERQLRDQRTLLAGVSHELRTPLGHLRLLVEILRTEGGCNDGRLDELERELIEMDDLVDRLLASSRLDFELERRDPIDAPALAIESLERAGVELDVLEVLRGVGPVGGDRTLIRRALANLISNAERHGGGVTRMEVSVTREGGIGFFVEDRGPGLPESEQQRLFEPFVTLDAPGRGGSLGLGLYLVRRIAQTHGGWVEAESLPGGGARVGVAFPRA